MINDIQFLNPAKLSLPSHLPPSHTLIFTYFHLESDFWCHQHLISLFENFYLNTLHYCSLALLPVPSFYFNSIQRSESHFLKNSCSEDELPNAQFALKCWFLL